MRRRPWEIAIPSGLLGWLIIRTPRRELALAEGVTREYADGKCGWTSERRRAFLFTTEGNDHRSARGMKHGLVWARRHLAHLVTIGENRVYKLTIVRVLPPKAKQKAG